MGKIWLSLSAVMGLSAIMAVFPTIASAQEAKTKVGVILTLSGPPAFAGLKEKDGLELALAKINGAGGVNDSTIETVIQDDAADPNTAVAAFNFLSGQDDIVAIIGSTIGSSTMAFAPLAKRDGVPILAPNSTHQITHLGNKYIFRVALPADVEADAAVAELIKRGYKKIGVLYTNDAYGKQGAELLAKKKGVNIAISEQVDAKATDYTPQLIKIRSANPDALVIWGGSPYPGIGIKSANQLGFDIPVYVPSAGASNATLKAAAGSALLARARFEGLYDNASPEPRQEEFLKLYREKFKTDPDSFSATGWDTGLLLTKGLELAGKNPSREKLREAFEKIKNVEGVQGVYSYSAESHEGTNADSVIWMKVTDGKFGKAFE